MYFYVGLQVGQQYELIGEGSFLLLRIFSFGDGLVTLCLEKRGQNDLECPAAGFAAP